MKIQYTRLKSEGYSATIAPKDSSNSNADYTCTGTGDETTINAAITTVSENGGGEIKLLPGTFNLTDSIELIADVIIKGSGVGATLINQTSTTAPAFLFSDANQSGITDLQIKIPRDSTTNAVTVDTSSAYRLEKLTFQGGSTDSWMIEDNGGFNFYYNNIKGSLIASWMGNGLHFTNDTAYNTGNGIVNFFEMMLKIEDGNGIYIEGSTKNVNLINFGGINIVNYMGNAENTIGINLYKASYLTFSMCDLELHENAIYFDNSGYNTFSGIYISGNTVGILNNSSSSYNTFIGGHVGDTITDEQSNEAKQLKLYGGDYGD